MGPRIANAFAEENRQKAIADANEEARTSLLSKEGTILGMILAIIWG